MAEISRTVQSLFEGTTLYSAEAGGPFGRNAQKSLACSRPWFEVSAQSKAIAEMVAQQLSMWDACNFWTQGLVALFDCCRGELFRQRGLLASNSRPGEPTVDNLSPFELIVHQHLSKAKRNSVGGKKHGGDFWRALFRHLDSEGILPEKQLEGIAKKLLMKARQKGYKVDTWAESYECKVQAILDNEKSYVLKRELTHALHNADRKAKNHLKKLGF
ncbi:MAG TPA: hypothetical protein VK813_01970 [Edaphobacter sp.]|jgi:hypothetical protein|nr:hypothetical protein [Edaphobacter sp.]